MEIFQTIWTALTTPNVELIKFFGIPFSFIEVSVHMLFFCFILNIESTKKQKIIYILTLYTLSIVFTFLITFDFAPVIRIILWPILIMLIFKTTLLKSIIATLLPSVVMLLFETIFIKVYTVFFNISYNDIATIPIYRESIVLLNYLSIYILYLLAKHFNFNITLLDDMNKSNRNVLIINSIFGIISIITQLYLVNFYSDNIPFSIILISSFCLLSYFFISIYSLLRTTKLEITEQSLEEAQLYNKSLKILHDNVRAFKHDFSNIVQAIGRIC